MAVKNKSPLKRAPGRLPGQSVDDQMRKLLDDFLAERMLIVALLLALAIMDWVRWLTESPANPMLTTGVTIAAMLWAIPQFLKTKRKLKNLKLGRDGERAVGQFLERARTKGYHVFHDVLADNANIDHVLVGPGGVFTIETKTYSKPTSGEAVINYDVANQTLSLGNIDLTKCLIQAKAQGGEISSLLDEYVTDSIPVQPVLVFPGWYVDSAEKSQKEVWVLEPKGFLKWLYKASNKLDASQINTVRQLMSMRAAVQA